MRRLKGSELIQAAAQECPSSRHSRRDDIRHGDTDQSGASRGQHSLGFCLQVQIYACNWACSGSLEEVLSPLQKLLQF